MKNKLSWFKSLPFGIAFGLVCLSAVRKVFAIPVNFSFAEGAEDILLSYLLFKTNDSSPAIGTSGTYVDVGCNEPIRYSNTFNLYLNGWRGINIDANRDLISKCQRIRKDDVSICCAVSDSEKEVTFHKSEDTAVSTIDEERLIEWKKQWTFNEADQEVVVTRTLTAILDAHLPNDERIDVLSVDVEGHDYKVLKGLDFSKFRPRIIIIEIHALDQIRETNIFKYLSAKEYSLAAYGVFSAYFVDNNVFIDNKG